MTDTKTDEAINRKLAEFMEICVEWSGDKITDGCDTCGYEALNHARQIPNYCSSSSPRLLLEEAVAKVTEKVGMETYAEELADELARKIPIPKQKAMSNGDVCGALMTATAEQIARSLAACIDDQRDGK